MNPARFLKKCLVDPPAAAASSRLVLRGWYGRLYWRLKPSAPLSYRLPTGGRLRLAPGHSFTHCFWPGVDAYEPDVRAALGHLLKPGDTFVDCGANVGYFSVMGLDLVGRSGTVVSVEANPATFELLKDNLALNGGGVPVHCALSSRSGDVEIFVPEIGDVYSSLRSGGLVGGASARSYLVPARTLDEVVDERRLSRVDVVKIDIEGGEFDVLRSAPRTMADHRPAFIVEYGTNTWPAFGATADDLLGLARERGYSLRLFDPAAGRPVDPPPDFWDRGYANVLLLPEGRGR